MQQEISVDILITFYNQEKWVDRTLGSILSQKTDFPVNIIVGDDGSTDGTVKKINKWVNEHNNVQYFIMDRDHNVKYEAIERVSKLRKKLLTYSFSKYFMFLDGDDYYIDDYKLQKQVNILENNKKCIGCAHNLNMYWQNTGASQPVLELYEEKIISKEEYWSKFYIPNLCFMFRNITNGIIPKELEDIWFDDNTITLFFVQYGDIYYIPDIMCNYVQYSSSSWNDRSIIERNIINAIDYYDEIKFAKQMTFYSKIRHHNEFIQLYRNRQNISSQITNTWKSRINKIGYNSLLYKITNYENNNLFQKMEVFIMILSFYMIKIKRRLFSK